MRVYTARWLLPVSSPPIRDGAVAVQDGTIVAAGPRESVLPASGAASSALTDLGEAAIVPGLVNAHTHVELSWMGDAPPPGGEFLRWVRDLLERRDAGLPKHARDAAEAAIASMVARGTVAIGDVSNESWVVPLLARSELCGVAFHEIYGFDDDDAASLLEAADERIAALAADGDVRQAGERWRLVATPHAPHTTSPTLIRALAARAAASGLPLSIHVAESEAESDLLRDGTGPFPELYRERGIWNERFEPTGLSPVEHLDRLGALTDRTLAVHCVRLSRADQSKLLARAPAVVTCPRSNRRLGVGTAPVPQLLASGLTVAVGTDSLGSAPDLDLLAEMATLREEHPSLTPAAVLRMATLNGALALGIDDRFGSIEPGKSDRLVVVPLAAETDDAADAICSRPDRVHVLGEAAR